MSQWNNSYVYNNQYQGPNTWNGDLNSQYVNQGYYPNRQYDSSNQQYVSFNEFINQMQTSGAPQPSGNNYNNVQYQNYGQYDYQNMPSTSHNAQIETYYAPNTSSIPNGPDRYSQNQYEAQPQEGASYANELILKSNLTPTATEFVPKKSSVKPSTSAQNIPESTNTNSSSSSNSGPTEYKKPHGSSSDTNWRERPQSSQQNEDSKHNKYEGNNRYQDNYRQLDRDRQSDKREDKQNDRREDGGKQNNRRDDRQNDRREDRDGKNDRKEDRDRQSDRREDRDRQNDRREDRDRQIDRREDRDRQSDRREDRDRQSDRREDRERPSDRREDRDRQNDRREDRDRQNERRDENREYGNRNRDRNRYHESNYNYDSNSRNNHNYDNSRSERNQSKSNSKFKNKDPDRTFYNSSINKGGQEHRNGKGEGSGKNRNWAGSQRLRAVDRNYSEDEQYANSYMQFREERAERMSKQDMSSPKYRGKQTSPPEAVHTEMTQRERLSEQLDKGTLECLVCCERVKQIDPVWSCGNCYHVLHLRCIRKWATSSVVEGKWRCPACQNTSTEIPREYRCMCGAARAPEYQRGGGAHTCGRACRRARACPHPCALLCHPGPCPPCQATVAKQCGCGAETRSVLCSSKLPQVCGRVCSRPLDCGVHACARDCHEGACDPCAETVTQVCYCPAAQSRSVPCTRETGNEKHWSCGESCSRILACGSHVCRQNCHPPPCAPCRLLPSLVLTCPCGHTELDKNSRKSCTDPIPLCGNICAKPLACGPAGDKHFCRQECHDGECPVCPDKTVLQCRCGHSNREVPCADLPEMYNNVLCQKKCNKKLSCGRHRCRTVCCAATSHRCAVVCGRTLSCQLHRCEEFCHTGHCAPCPRVSFEELRCACGAQVALPPVRCGARAPACDAPCRRRRACGHPPHHSCHQGDCPPCVVLTTKRCHGQHEERKTIPCSQDEFSCGLPCGKPLPCGKHTCIKTCHKGECDTGKCTQPCTEKRPSCGHPCAAACHSATGSACPSSAPCRRAVRATCGCARRTAERACADNARDYAKMMSALAATKMQEGGSVDLSDVQRPGSMLKTLECDDECRVEQRTRQMALALQIRNPDVSAKLAPRYSDGLRATAAREPAFAQQVHDRLTELVHLAKKSKQKTRAHSFPSMNWQKRQFIHELCEHFGCESVAYDAEPNRNVVATADKEKSWLPAMSVLEVVAREAGKRRVPGPVLRAPPAPPAPLHAPHDSARSSGWATLTSTNAWAARSNQSKPAPAPQPDKIDYFDCPPDN